MLILFFIFDTPRPNKNSMPYGQNPPNTEHKAIETVYQASTSKPSSENSVATTVLREN